MCINDPGFASTRGGIGKPVDFGRCLDRDNRVGSAFGAVLISHRGKATPAPDFAAPAAIFFIAI
jgi:hypothetical protein